MHRITMYLDFVSPYAWLAFQQLPQTLQGLSYHVEYRPLLLGALFQQNSNPGPVGIPSKRIWTYRHALWLGKHMGIPMQMPTHHPFNPLPLLRMALQTSQDGSINRYVAETLFRHVWEGGKDALDTQRLQDLQAHLAQQLRADEAAVAQAKHWLRTNTEQAAQAGVFGVPAFAVNGEVFWGVDSMPMLRQFVEGDAWFASPAWENASTVPSGLA